MSREKTASLLGRKLREAERRRDEAIKAYAEYSGRDPNAVRARIEAIESRLDGEDWN